MRRKWSDLAWAFALLVSVALISRVSMSPSTPSSPARGGTVTIGHVRPGMTRAEVEKLCGPYLRAKVGTNGSDWAAYTAPDPPVTIVVTYRKGVVKQVDGPHFELDGRLDDLSNIGLPDKVDVVQRHGSKYESWLRYGLSSTCFGGDCGYTVTKTSDG